MPRDGTGTYTLPVSNPVAPFTTIATAWANPTMSDIASALTDSLSRSGQGGMLAPFKVADGTISAPGLGFINEPGIGLYRESAGIAHLVNSGVQVITIKAGDAQFPEQVTSFKDWRVHAVGFKSFIVRNTAGELIFAPSTAVNGDTPDLALGASLLANGTFDVYKLSISGAGQGIQFADGSIQTTASGVKGVRRGVITIPNGSSAADSPILNPIVVPTKTEVRFLGTRATATADVTSGVVGAFAHVQLNGNNFITASRYPGNQSNSCEVSWELTEYY